MLYGLEGESSAILKHKEETSNKVCCSGLWVDPKLPFLTCSPDSLVGKDTVTKIKSLKIFKQYSVQAVTLERIARDQPLIAKISEFLTTFWMRVVAPKIFGMRISGIFCLSFCHN